MRFLVVLLICLSLAACGSRRSTGTSRQTDLITFAEMVPLRVASAYEVILQLRPEYMRTRGSPSVNNPVPVEAVVYLDGIRHGGLASLRSIRKETIREIRYIDSREATTQYGTGHRGGAILVVTR